MAGLIEGLYGIFQHELRTMTPKRAAFRLLRSARVLGMRSAHAVLSESPSLQMQHAKAWQPDPFFYLANRHYLMRGLSRQQRTTAALAHYGREDRQPAAYREAVYGEGLPLWQVATEGAVYEIRLRSGKGVLFEGGLSVEMTANGEEVCLISFSVLPASVLGPAAEGMPAEVVLVGRKQQARDHAWQADYNKAFNHTAAPRLVMAALAGVALAQGLRAIVCIKADRHPNFTEDRREGMEAGYDGFWATMDGQDVPGVGRLLTLPLESGPVDHLDRSKRKRALARRAHIARVCDEARAAVRAAIGAPQEG